MNLGHCPSIADCFEIHMWRGLTKGLPVFSVNRSGENRNIQAWAVYTIYGQSRRRGRQITTGLLKTFVDHRHMLLQLRDGRNVIGALNDRATQGRRAVIRFRVSNHIPCPHPRLRRKIGALSSGTALPYIYRYRDYLDPLVAYTANVPNFQMLTCCMRKFR